MAVDAARMAVDGWLRHRCRAVLPDLRPHRSGQAVRPQRRLRPQVRARAATGGSDVDLPALDRRGWTAPGLPRPDRRSRPRAPGVVATSADAAQMAGREPLTMAT